MNFMVLSLLNDNIVALTLKSSVSSTKERLPVDAKAPRDKDFILSTSKKDMEVVSLREILMLSKLNCIFFVFLAF
uniref:Uncharacterized protein n=1 Tax=Rhizophora mucronata TaxID=61149 RepID=A0A2P2MUG9_RHIMU